MREKIYWKDAIIITHLPGRGIHFICSSFFLTGMLKDKCEMVCQIHFEKSLIERLNLSFIFASIKAES